MPLEVRVLGATEFTWEGEALRLDRPLERAFAVRLALARGTPVSDDALALDLWGDVEQTRPAERLRVLASRLRASLGPAAAALRRVPGGYVLDAVPVDLAELDAAWGVSRAPSVRPSADVAELLTLWRGPALSDLRAVPFARDEGERLDGVRLDLELAHLSGLIDHGAAVPAAAELERLAQQRPLHERAACLLALALYRSGRQADALDRLARLRASLADELGVDPSPETAELEVRILRHSPELAAALQPSDAPALGLPAPATRFVGREGELAALVEQLRAAAVITLAGAPGAGKTRLAAEVARTERSRGRQVVWVDLAPLRDEQALLPAVLAAAGVEHGGDELGRLAAALDGALLVVDNAEHLVERAAALVRSLAGAAAGLSVLVTSAAAAADHRRGAASRDAAAAGRGCSTVLRARRDRA